jgi:phage tail sheath protein FI
MPEYLYPGVYVEEVDTGNKPIEGVSTSTVGFLGIAERGPTKATLITSFGDYTRAFGRYVKDPDGIDHYLTYAVEGFFQNGGKRCFVQRVAHSDPVTGANSASRARAVLPALTIWATGPGTTGNNIAYQIGDAGLDPANLFKLTVLYWAGTPPSDLTSNPTVVEVFDNLSSTPGAGTFYESEINDISNLVVIKQTAPGRPANNASGANPNLQVGAIAGLTDTSPLNNGATLTLTRGAAPPLTLTVNTAVGPIKTVADLMSNVNADATVGAKASLDATGHLNIFDPQNHGNITLGGTLAAGGAGNLGAFTHPLAGRVNNAGPALQLAKGSDGINPNLLVGSVGGLAGATALAAGGTLTLTSGAKTVTFTQGAPIAAPIMNVNDLIAAIGADVTVGAKASLDASGHLNITDPQNGGNLSVTGTLAAAGVGNLGVFAPATATLSPADFEGFDPDPFAISAFAATAAVNKSGLLGLQDVDEISILTCPDEFYLGGNNFTIAGLLRDQCEQLKDRFAILQAPLAAGTPENNNPSINSKYAAYYYPWLKITNPLTNVPLLIPSGGHIAGIYARSDTNVGVHKDPANEVINGITELQLPTNDQQQAILNPKGVDVLRYFKGAGNLVWGGRTTSIDPDWKYINVRRLFIFVEKSILRGTQWVVFEINDEPTWARVRRSVGDFLTGLWRDGMLQGAKKEEAFFVKCDRTTMTQADIDNGRLICLIGIAPVKPAEFVIFRIGQWYGGSNVSEG